MRYNKKGGKVTIITRTEDGHPTLIVKDTGIGIPKEAQERVFERFYREDESHNNKKSGYGIGLSMAQTMVKLFKGSISVSYSGDTITFLVSL